MAREFDTRKHAGVTTSETVLSDGTVSLSQSVEAVKADALQKQYLDALSFMEEPVEVVVHETADEYAENPVVVGVNGQIKQFFRGVPTVAKRKFVEGLIVKSGRVSTPERYNPAGERVRVIVQQSAHKYPFTVIKDNNPKGAEWLKRRLAESI